MVLNNVLGGIGKKASNTFQTTVSGGLNGDPNSSIVGGGFTGNKNSSIVGGGITGNQNTSILDGGLTGNKNTNVIDNGLTGNENTNVIDNGLTGNEDTNVNQKVKDLINPLPNPPNIDIPELDDMPLSNQFDNTAGGGIADGIGNTANNAVEKAKNTVTGNQTGSNSSKTGGYMNNKNLLLAGAAAVAAAYYFTSD